LDRKQKKALLVRNAIRRAGLPVLEIAYEDLVENPSSLKSICEFLSLPQPQVLPESKFVKNRQKSQADVVRNYAEVQAVLSGTPYIEWLEKNEGQPF
jgi:LPS sulfotransferase NodH